MLWVAIFFLAESEIGGGSIFEANILVELLPKTKFLASDEFKIFDRLKTNNQPTAANLLDFGNSSC